jgi:hypothetical protein
MGRPLVELADTADEVAADTQQIAGKLRKMEEQREQGWTWKQIIDRDTAPRLPELITRASRRLATVGRRLQETIANGLASEGRSHGRIAEYFNISRQRISKLLSKQPPNRERAA